MYKLLIVDDEIILRQGLIKTINWAALGFEIVGEAGDGQEALAKIEALVPDVVLTDICMPQMDGLSMLETASRGFPKMKFVILTGFEEFEYAKRGLELGAVDYISKITLTTEIPVVFEKLRWLLDQQRETERRLNTIISDRERLFRWRYFSNLLNNQPISSDMKRPELKNQYYCLAYFYVDSNYDLLDDKCEEEPNRYEILRQCGIDEKQRNLCLIDTGEALTVVHFNREPSFETIKQQWEDVSRQGLQLGNKLINFGIVLSREFPGVDDIAREYAKIKKHAFAHVGNKKGELILTQFLSDSQDTGIQVKQQNDLFTALSEGNKYDIEAQINALRQSVLDGRVSAESFKNLVIEMYSMCSFKMRELGITAVTKYFKNKSLYTEITNCMTIRCLWSLFEAMANNYADEIRYVRRKPIEQSIEIAREYIESHCCEKLSLSDVANIVYLSPAYFSSMFKKINNISFGDYLCQLRMEKARKYLQAGKTVTQTAALTGYNDMKHFGKMFKKFHDGKSPNDFRK